MTTGEKTRGLRARQKAALVNAEVAAGRIMETEYLHPHEVAALLQIPRARVKRLAAAGELPAITLPNGEYRFPREALLRVIETWRSPTTRVQERKGAAAEKGELRTLVEQLAWLDGYDNDSVRAWIAEARKVLPAQVAGAVTEQEMIEVARSLSTRDLLDIVEERCNDQDR